MKKFRVTFIIEKYLTKSKQVKAYKIIEVTALCEEQARSLAFKKVMGLGTRYYVLDTEEIKDG